MKKYLLTGLITCFLVIGCTDENNNPTNKKTAQSTDNNANNSNYLTIKRSDLFTQLQNTFPSRLCNNINLAKLKESREKCEQQTNIALQACINSERTQFPNVIKISKTEQAQQVIGTLKPIFDCTKAKMGIPEEEKLAIKLNFQFNQPQ